MDRVSPVQRYMDSTAPLAPYEPWGPLVGVFWGRYVFWLKMQQRAPVPGCFCCFFPRDQLPSSSYIGEICGSVV